MKAKFKVSSLALTLLLSLSAVAVIFGQGEKGRATNRFDASTNAPAVSKTMHDAPEDFNGDGRTDFSILRPGPGDQVGTMTWWIRLNGPDTHSGTQFGFNGDNFIPADYDGDGSDDIAIWRGQPAPAGFWVLKSSDNTAYFVPMGQIGDDPFVVADYTNDGVDDMAVFRPGAEQSYFWIWPSSGPYVGNFAGVPWGFQDDIALFGDYNGDGFADFTVIRTEGNPARSNVYTRFGSLDLAWTGYTSELWGFDDDFYVPGDYDGDGKTDLAVTRQVGIAIQWIIKPSGGGPLEVINFGNNNIDIEVQGDYDGDGKTDVAVWRRAGTLTGYFIVRLSTGGFMFEKWGGLSQDLPTTWEFKG